MPIGKMRKEQHKRTLIDVFVRDYLSNRNQNRSFIFQIIILFKKNNIKRCDYLLK